MEKRKYRVSEIWNELSSHHMVVFLVFVICISIAALVVYRQPTVFESKLTFVVTANSKEENMDKGRNIHFVDSIAKLAGSSSVLRPFDIYEKSDRDTLLQEDYTSAVIRIQNMRNNGRICIYAHGNTPEEAQQICRGVYQHLLVFSERNSEYDIDKIVSTDKLLQMAKNRKHESMWQNIYDKVLEKIMMNKWETGWSIMLAEDANLPTSPIPKRIGFIFGIGVVCAGFFSIIFGMCAVVFKGR